MKKTGGFLTGALLFCIGVIIGFIFAPIKKGVNIGNNSGNNNGNHDFGKKHDEADRDKPIGDK
jgi:hypothetical protein